MSPRAQDVAALGHLAVPEDHAVVLRLEAIPGRGAAVGVRGDPVSDDDLRARPRGSAARVTGGTGTSQHRPPSRARPSGPAGVRSRDIMGLPFLRPRRVVREVGRMVRQSSRVVTVGFRAGGETRATPSIGIRRVDVDGFGRAEGRGQDAEPFHLADPVDARVEAGHVEALHLVEARACQPRTGPAASCNQGRRCRRRLSRAASSRGRDRAPSRRPLPRAGRARRATSRAATG